MRCLEKGRGCVLHHIILKLEKIPFALILQASALKLHRIFPSGYIFVQLSVCTKYNSKAGSDSHLLCAGLSLVPLVLPTSYWTAARTEDECQWKAAEFVGSCTTCFQALWQTHRSPYRNRQHHSAVVNVTKLHSHLIISAANVAVDLLTCLQVPRPLTLNGTKAMQTLYP